MATPAASPIQKRYTAGSCTLDVVLQLSALSQWYPQPIVQDLRFKLWIQPIGRSRGVATLPRLMAEGDRTVLQEISQYLSQAVQSELAIAHLSKNAPPPPKQPSSLQLTQPLSYLQLCDLTTVMHQCEQANPALPVAIASVPAAPNLAAQPASDISHRRRASSVIPFAAVRRHPKLWASSAAAALLAVGLTATVWQNDQNSSSFTTATAPSELNSSRPNADLVPKTALPRKTVETPERAVSSQTGSLEPDTSAAEGQNIRPEASRRVEPAVVPPRSRTQNVTPAPALPQVIAAAPSTEAIQPSPAVQSEPPPVLETDELVSASVPEAIPEPVPELAPEPISEPVPKVPAAQLPTQTEALARRPDAKRPEIALPSPQSESIENDSSDSEPSLELGRTNPRPLSRAARQSSPLPASALPPDPLPSDTNDGDTNAVIDEGVIEANASFADQVTAQAQPYFQGQWNRAEVVIETALAYTMRVSEVGEIVEFEAEGETAMAYRDRLQPEGLVIDVTQENGDAIANLTFKVEITPDGQVNITQTP